MGAILQAEYPGLWPETVRALLIHSATWTPRMLQEFNTSTRSSRRQLMRCYGYGVPDLNQARWSARNALTLIVQDELQPFRRDRSSAPKNNEMNVHEFPWPRDVLLGLGGIEVELRVTLSYFVEPNPGRRGRASRHVYPSHKLRFDVRRPAETIDEFRKRVNKAARAEDEGSRQFGSRQENWVLGPKSRNKGSIHSDIWRGPAADLANRGCLAVYPATGWWYKNPGQRRWTSKARYALVVSIKTPMVTQDVYTPVAIAVSVPVAVIT
jgi:hypothetical protein